MRKSSILILLALFAFAPTVWAQNFGGGSGTVTNPYIIQNTDHWNELVTYVANGNNTEGVYFKQTGQIYPTTATMLGTSQYPFKGFYYSDSNNHYITYDINTDEQYAAPFHYVDGATISNVRVYFSVLTTSAQFAGGLVGHATGDVHINGCSITGGTFTTEINSTVVGDGSHGGFVGYHESGDLILTNCLFAGKMLGYNTSNCGGFVGWSESNNGATVRMVNCFFYPTLQNMNTSGCMSFVRARDMENVTLQNCYASMSAWDLQGATSSSTMSDLTVAGLLGDGWNYASPTTPSTNLNTIATAIVNGLQYRYVVNHGDPIDIAFTVTRADGRLLTEGTDYSVVFQKGSQSMTSVTEAGNYTLNLFGESWNTTVY